MIPEGFTTILADPPWQYGDSLPGPKRGARKHYGVMPTYQIAHLPMKPAENAHLYLWTTNSFIREALYVMGKWGFEYKTMITWVKTTNEPELVGHGPKVRIGMGRYLRNVTEQCLFGVRGKLRPLNRSTPNVIFAPRGEHSAKPAQMYSLIESLSPGPYLELFARQTRLNWTSWGNEV